MRRKVAAARRKAGFGPKDSGGSERLSYAMCLHRERVPARRKNIPVHARETFPGGRSYWVPSSSNAKWLTHEKRCSAVSCPHPIGRGCGRLRRGAV